MKLWNVYAVSPSGLIQSPVLAVFQAATGNQAIAKYQHETNRFNVLLGASEAGR